MVSGVACCHEPMVASTPGRSADIHRVRATRDDAVVTDEELAEIEARLTAASPGPWTSFVEGRDHQSGDDFIRISESDAEDDMYVSRFGASGTRPASAADQDFIAHARQDIPALIAEVRRLRESE